jgi:hypothetical protein
MIYTTQSHTTYFKEEEKKKGKVGSILTFSSHVYVSQEVQNQKHLFQFAQVLHTAPCHQFSKKIPLS